LTTWCSPAVAARESSEGEQSSDLYPPFSVANVFRKWLHGIYHKFRTFTMVGSLAIIWSLWLYRNDKIFNDKTFLFYRLSPRCTGTHHF
jgi:hypothetical protein